MDTTSFPDLLDTIESTPIARLRNIIHDREGRLIVKLESANPGGSLKDRAAWHIISKAEEAGMLKPGATIIESSSGNFGIALAMIGAARGYRVVAVVDPKITPSNRALLEAYGAEVVVVHEQDSSGSYHMTRIALANRMHRAISNSFRPDQCFNLQNSEAHYLTTGPELDRQVGPSLRYVVCSVSTGGQIGGLSRYFAEHNPSVRVVGVDVEGSAIFGGPSRGYLTPGVGLGWTPANLSNMSLLHSVYKLSDQDAFTTTRTLAAHEGLLAGVSTGACVLVALSLAMSTGPHETVACLAADRGERYLATAFNDQWLSEHSLDHTLQSVSQIRSRAAGLIPLSTNPGECANHKPLLAEELDSPTANDPRFNPYAGAGQTGSKGSHP